MAGTLPHDDSTLDDVLARCLEAADFGDTERLERILDRFPQWREELESYVRLDRLFRDARPIFPTDLPDLELLDERRIGFGSMGHVYRARQRSTGRIVAVKVIRPEIAARASTLERFRREARAGLRLRHRHVVSVLDVQERAGVHYLVLEYAEGGSLRDRLGAAVAEGRPLDERQVLRWGAQIAAALARAHRASIVHRDVKPSNILFTANGVAKLADFGIAYDPNEADLTTKEERFGHAHYTAPELLERSDGSRREVGPAADVYSLCATLYECLAGRVPFEGTEETIRRKVRLEFPEPLHRVCPDRVSAATDAVIRRGLHSSLRRRHRSAEDLARELRRARRGEAVHSKPPGPMEHGLRWARRHPVLSLAITTVTAFAGVLLAYDYRLSTALEDTTRERNERHLAAASYERMADAHQARVLLQEVDGLWPRRRWKEEALRSWVARADAILDRSAAHRARLDELTAAAHPLTAEDRESQERLRAERYPRLVEDERRASRDAVQFEERLRSDTLGAQEHRQLERALARALEFRDEVRADPRFTERLIWSFDREVDAWAHTVMRELVADLDHLASARAHVSRRIEALSAIEAASVTSESAEFAWNAFLAAISATDEDATAAASFLERLGGERVGLLPLGRDARSGLWEFWHVESGERPLWHGTIESGFVEMLATSGIVLVLVPGGEFVMGSQSGDPEQPNHDPQASLIEAPLTRITLRPFLISKYEITRAQWERLDLLETGRETPRNATSDLLPVTSVTWSRANRVLAAFELGLPSEAQWEYAARAGRSTPWPCGSDPACLARHANLSDTSLRDAWPQKSDWLHEDWSDGFGDLAPVGSLEPNALGLHDLLGNVGEWCRDYYCTYRVAPTGPDGERPFDGTDDRVWRGGSYSSLARHARVSHRTADPPGLRSSYVGVRAIFAR